ncbi:hypothetical protein DJ52_06145 [Brachyspira murdochii]|uniref:Apolipoprotein A1/A4/E n=1 Tax=Brachyspira murdochii TaxID=84378 RepID=A0ABX5B7U7_9SPIR|nr:hypothetical protein [Brachyspira murdochii]PPS22232.1 hypothetical protein DJ52_06145 [Brachyspira murdochii]
MNPVLQLILTFVVPLLFIGIYSVINRKKNYSDNNFSNIFAEEKAALEGIVEEKISEVRDNAIDLEIAVKKAGFISKSMEEDIAKLNKRIESYKDYKAAVSQYQEQVDSLEEAYLEILNKVDTVLKERNTIEKTYKRISDVKAKMSELEKNVGSIQDKLIESYNSKLNEFESELYKRFDALTTNLLARDAHYSTMAEQEKEKISALTEEFKLHVAKKEELFTNQLTQLAERTARHNIEQLAELFEKGRDELINKYSSFADEIDVKSKDIENRYETLSQSKDGLETELNNLRDTIHDRLNSITESSVLEFQDEMEKTKEMLYSTLKEGLEKISIDREEFLDSIEQKAHSLEKSIDDIKDKADYISKDYAEKAHQLESEFSVLKDDINNRFIAEVENFSNHIKNVLENEDDGVITLYRNKTKELNDLIISIDGMSEETMLRAESRFEDIVNDIDKLKDDILTRAQDDMEYSIDNARSSLIAEINELRNDVETETNLLKDKIDETHYQTSEIISILNNKQEEILDSLSLQKEYLYKDLETQANDRVNEIEKLFATVKNELEENINTYIKNTSSDLTAIDEKISGLKEQYDKASSDIDTLSKETESNIKDNIEKRLEILEKTSVEINGLVSRTNEKLDIGMKDAEDRIEGVKKEISDYSNAYIDSLKSHLKTVLDDYEQTKMKAITDSIDSVISQVDESEKRHDALMSSIENSLDDFRNKVDTAIDENIKFNEETKKEVADMLHDELRQATDSFDTLLNEKRESMNKIKDEIEDILHRVENGRDAFERTINKVYENAEDKEKELMSDIEDKYNSLDKKIDGVLDERRADLNAISAEYHAMLEKYSNNLKDDYEELKHHASLMTDEYKMRIENLGERISEIIDNANNMQSVVDTKTGEMNSYIADKKDEIAKRTETIFTNIEYDTSKKLDELKLLIDNAIAKYQDEIKEIETYRLEENKSIIEDVENIGAGIRKDYEQYTNMLEELCNKEKTSLNEYVNTLKDEIEKAREESEAKHLTNEANYIDDYLNKASSKIDDEVNRLNEELNDSFNTLYSGFSKILAKIRKANHKKALQSIAKIKKHAEKVISNTAAEVRDSLGLTLEDLRNEFISLKDNVDDRLREQADKLISNNENVLAILDDHEIRLEKMNDISNIIETIKETLSEQIDEIKSNISDSNEDVNNRMEEIKSSIIDREELINLHDSERELLKNQIEDIKEEFELFKDNIVRTNEVEIPALFDEEKERIERMFDEFSKNLLMRLTDNESDIHYIKDVLSEERSHLISQIELLRKDVDDIKDDNTVTVLSGEKAVLENSLTALRDDFDKIMDLEKDFVSLKNRMEGIDSGLKDDVKDLSDKLKSFRDNLEEKIEKDSNGLYKDIENLNKNFETVKNNISSLLDRNEVELLINNEKERLNSIFESLASNNEDFKDRLEKRISYFEDVWSDNTRIKSIYASDIREEVENIRKEADVKYDNHIAQLKEKMKLIEEDIYDWKNGNLNTLLAQLEDARKGIESFIDTFRI